MKGKFSGYYRQMDLSVVINSNKVVIVLDSSVLCNLYGLHDDVWMPVIEMIGKRKMLYGCLTIWLVTTIEGLFLR